MESSCASCYVCPIKNFLKARVGIATLIKYVHVQEYAVPT